MHNLKIPPASSKKFPKKTHSGHHACVTKQSPVRFSRKIAQALSSTCPNKEFSDMHENRWCTPCVPHSVWTSSKKHLPQATIFHREDKGQCTKCAGDHLIKLKIPICLSSEKCSDEIENILSRSGTLIVTWTCASRVPFHRSRSGRPEHTGKTWIVITTFPLRDINIDIFGIYTYSYVDIILWYNQPEIRV